MKGLILVLFVILTSGCSVNHAKWSDAEVLCKSFGGVKSVPTTQNFAECNHGVYVQRVN